MGSSSAQIWSGNPSNIRREARADTRMGVGSIGSVEHTGFDIGSVDGGVTTGGPAGSLIDEAVVGGGANEELAGRNAGALDLSVATEAEVIIALDEQFGADGAVRLVASDAAFPHGFVFEHFEGALFAVALDTGFILSGHGEAAGRFHDIAAVRIVTLNAVHLAFHDGVPVGEVKLAVHFEVALEAALRVPAGVENELTFGGGLGMFAAGAVARFAPGHARGGAGVDVPAGVGTFGEDSDEISVAIFAGVVTDVIGPGGLQGDD